jgi:Protein of unknown function (DUF2769)
MADLFEKKLEELCELSEDEVKIFLAEEKVKCNCPGCPTFNECMKENKEGLFCAFSESNCVITRKFCLCRECPVYADYGMKFGFFCIYGSEQEQRENKLG